MTKEIQWTLVVDFYKGFQYPILLDPAIRHDGDLMGKILHCLNNSLVSPLPNPKDLRLRTPAGELITSDQLFTRTLAGYFPKDEAGTTERIIHVGRAESFLGLSKTAAKAYLDRVRWKVDL
jgi:hypothetical protein